MDTAFAWAMIRLDGADVPMIHCISADSEEDLATGSRVRAVWADEPRGYITDIRCFELIGEKGSE
jgi:hypothetical protein